MLRYKLRTLLIVLALGPPVLAGVWWAWPILALALLALSPLMAALAGLGLWVGICWCADRL